MATDKCGAMFPGGSFMCCDKMKNHEGEHEGGISLRSKVRPGDSKETRHQWADGNKIVNDKSEPETLNGMTVIPNGRGKQ